MAPTSPTACPQLPQLPVPNRPTACPQPPQPPVPNHPPRAQDSAWEEGCEAFLQRSLQGCTLPSFLYHFPRHTQQHITVAMYQRLAAALPTLQGIKDSGGDLALAKAPPPAPLYPQAGLG